MKEYMVGLKSLKLLNNKMGAKPLKHFYLMGQKFRIN